MKRILFIVIAFAVGLLFQSCTTLTYYNYYEVEDTETATVASKQDAYWDEHRKTPTRCVGCYVYDGKKVYLMETKAKEKIYPKLKK